SPNVSFHVYLLAAGEGKRSRARRGQIEMPADAWAVQFPVGKCFHPAEHPIWRKARPIGTPELSRGQARPELAERVERNSGTRDPKTRDHMLTRMPGRIDDTMLVREAQRGSRAAFEELVRQYDQAVLRLALHLTGSDHEAQDIYQEAFLKAYKSIGRFR